VDILVEDGRGGSITASLPITVRSSHHPPVLTGPSHVQVAQQLLGIPPPVSPDGDTLVVTINALPRGTVRNGAAILHPGDHVAPEELSKLTFAPEAGFMGPAGALRYSVDNGHGGIVDGSVDVEVGTSAMASGAMASGAVAAGPEAALWESVRGSSDPARLEAFLRLFPASRFTDDAKRRIVEVTAPKARTEPAQVAESAPARPAQVAESAPARPAQVAESQPARPGLVAVAQAAEAPQPGRIVTAANVPVVPPSQQARGGSANRFQDCPGCPWMIRIPAGGFMMGQGARESEALPAHHVDVHAFAIGQTPVTVGDWKACLSAKACGPLPPMRVAEDRTPLHNLSWEDASQYVAWLSKVAGRPYRLPSEAEWEYAARAGTTTKYWWGDTVGTFQANCNDCGGVQETYGPLPVDALPANPFGLYGMLGGVAQWTADCWFPNYKGAPANAGPREAKSCDKRVLRGGSFRAAHDEITVTYRGNYDAPVRYIVNGFRVARDLE
jgi:formylglycine-generating enzyme required for sulfatase activity